VVRGQLRGRRKRDGRGGDGQYLLHADILPKWLNLKFMPPAIRRSGRRQHFAL